MSYIQIEFLGKLRGLKFNQGALIEYRDKADLNSHNATAAYAMFWAGLKAYAYVKGEEFDMTFEQVCDGVDTLTDEVVLSVLNAFQESVAYQKLIAKAADAEDEKKNIQVTEPIVTDLQDG